MAQVAKIGPDAMHNLDLDRSPVGVSPGDISGTSSHMVHQLMAGHGACATTPPPAPTPQQTAQRVGEQRQSLAAMASQSKSSAAQKQPASTAMVVRPTAPPQLQKQRPVQVSHIVEGGKEMTINDLEKARLEPAAILKDHTYIVPVTFSIETSLQELKAGKTQDFFTLPLRKEFMGKRVVIQQMHLTASGNALKRIGILFPDLEGARQISHSGGELSSPFHVRVSMIGEQAERVPVFVREKNINPYYLAKYGNVISDEQLMAEINTDATTGYFYVPFTSIIGSIMQHEENWSRHVGDPRFKGKDGRKYIVKKDTNDINEIINDIKTKVLDSAGFQNTLINPGHFRYEMVPLDKNTSWTHVPDVNDAPKECKRPLKLTLEGVAHVFVVPSIAPK